MKDSREGKERPPETAAASPRPARVPCTGQERSSSPGACSEGGEYYRQIFQTLRAPVLLVDPETGRILECNEAAAGFYGSSAETLSGTALWDLNALTQEELFRELLQSASRPQKLFMVRQRLGSGDIRDVELSYSSVRVGEKIVLSALARDVSKAAAGDQLAAGEVLRQAVSEAAFRLLTCADLAAGLASALDGFAGLQGLARLDLYEMTDALEGQLLVNHLWQWTAGTGQLRPGDPGMRGVPLGGPPCLSPDELKRGLPAECPVGSFPQPLRAVLEADSVRSVLIVPAVANGTPGMLLAISDSAPNRKWTEEETHLYHRFASCLAGSLVRERAERDLRRSVSRYRSLIDSSADVLFQTDATGLWTLLSPSWTGLTGFAPAESIGEFWLNNVHHDDRQSVALDFQALLEGKITAMRSETRLISKDGSARQVRLLANPLRDESGRVTGTSGALQQITAPPATDAGDRYRRLFQELNEIIFVASPEGKLIDINRAGVETLRYSSKDDLLSKNVYSDIFADALDGQRFSDELERAGSVRDFDAEVKTERGDRLTLSIAAVRTSDPPLVVYQGIAHDVTRRKKQEQELLFTKKMEAVGQLAGGVAHDFNNILTGIRGYAEILRAKLTPDSVLTTYVDRIITSSERGAHITEGLMSFSRKRKARTERLDMDDLLENSRALLSRILGADIQVVLRASGTRPQVMADRSQIEQVLMHLSANARDAMPRGGVFTVASEVVRLDADFRRLHGYGEPGTFVRISVSDTGTGMEEKTRERVFEPFFTTREVGKGTGLGLSIVYGIIKQHRGYITVRSAPGQGSTFEIYLPLAAAKEEALRPMDFQMPKGGSETILLAEDDEVVSDLIRSILEGFGYHVISAADGEDAVAKFRENRDRVRLLISDVMMPRKTGKEIYEEVRSLRPDLKVIFISGYDEDIACGRGIFEKGLPIIPKPFSTSDLLTRVRAVLDEQPVGRP